jgi:hypothetical protein
MPAMPASRAGAVMTIVRYMARITPGPRSPASTRATADPDATIDLASVSRERSAGM